ncbi:MAG: PilZ domain-containing protein [Phycisphaerae bacterium]
MSTGLVAEYMTREKWHQALFTYKERDSSPSYAKGRRKHLRFRMAGWATVFIDSADKQSAQTLQGCQLLDVSEEGIALRVPRKIEPNTAVTMELHVSGRIFRLSGRAIYHARLPGAVRVGFKLEFRSADQQTNSTDG